MDVSETKPERERTVLAAILFTDAVGFSAYAREDESRALEAIHADHAAMRALCAQHDGRVVKSTGDGLMMMFDSAVSAFQCGLAMLRDLPSSPLRHRLGLHLGDVIVGPDDVMGDGVNIASRLQELAQPGEMCASQTVVDVVQSRLKFAVRPMGEQSLKNIPQPIRVYAVDPFSSDTRRLRGRPHWNARLAGYVLAAIAVVAVGTPLWMLALRPPVVAPGSTASSGPLTLSPELAGILEQGAAPVQGIDTEADLVSEEQPVATKTPEEEALAKKVKDLEALQAWFGEQMKAYPKDKPLALPAENGAKPTQVWSDASEGVVAQIEPTEKPEKVRASTFVRASNHLISRMPDGPEKVALIRRLESLAVPRKSGEKRPEGTPKPPPVTVDLARTLPVPKEVQERLSELKNLQVTIHGALESFGPDRPFELRGPNGQPLSLWIDADGELVGDTGDGAAAPVHAATLVRLAHEIVKDLPPGPEREKALKTLESLSRRRGSPPPPAPPGG